MSVFLLCLFDLLVNVKRLVNVVSVSKNDR
jgi:hypothetical protein